MAIRLSQEWTRPFHDDRGQHRGPHGQARHRAGIPRILASAVRLEPRPS
jgi:hypothetical protein